MPGRDKLPGRFLPKPEISQGGFPALGVFEVLYVIIDESGGTV